MNSRIQNELVEHRERHQTRVEKALANDFASCLMNTTKWMELFGALRDLGLQYRVKHIIWEEPTNWSWIAGGRGYSGIPEPNIEGSFSPIHCREIEWLEIDPVQKKHPAVHIDHSEEVKRRLDALSIPHEWREGATRVTGYVRKL